MGLIYLGLLRLKMRCQTGRRLIALSFCCLHWQCFWVCQSLWLRLYNQAVLHEYFHVCGRHNIASPSVSALQRLLHVCEAQLQWLDMSINVNKSACIRIGPRHKETCYNLVTLDGRDIRWTNIVRYLGIYLVSAKMFRCAIDNSKKSFYRSFNSIFGKVGRTASEHVTVELLKVKCLPVLLYGLEVCSLTKAQIKSLDYAVSSCYKKISMLNLTIMYWIVWTCLNVMTSARS